MLFYRHVHRNIFSIVIINTLLSRSCSTIMLYDDDKATLQPSIPPGTFSLSKHHMQVLADLVMNLEHQPLNTHTHPSILSALHISQQSTDMLLMYNNKYMLVRYEVYKQTKLGMR